MKNIFEKCIEKLILYGSQDLLKNEGAQTEEKNQRKKNKEMKEEMGIENNEWRKLQKNIKIVKKKKRNKYESSKIFETFTFIGDIVP